jgi:hypothetical protein
VRLEYRVAPRTGRIEARLDGRSLKNSDGLKYTLGPSWKIDEPFFSSRPRRRS